MTEKEREKTYYTIAALIITGLLLTYPVRSLAAVYYFQRAAFILRNDGSDKGKALPVSGRTMPAYIDAIQSLENAVKIAPSGRLYARALSEVYTRMGHWAAAMEAMHEPLPDGAMNSSDAYRRAERYLKAAIKSDPANPDPHFALGQLHDITDRDSGLAEKELSRAIAAYPVNASLRYAVAEEHLRAGRKGDAIEQAGRLAGLAGQNTTDNYLFRAFDIAWRASGNPEVVKGICPDGPAARQAIKKYLESKGIRE